MGLSVLLTTPTRSYIKDSAERTELTGVCPLAAESACTSSTQQYGPGLAATLEALPR